MKITRKQIKQIVKEEMQNVLSEDPQIRYPHIVQYLKDPHGNPEILVGSNLQFTLRFIKELSKAVAGGKDGYTP